MATQSGQGMQNQGAMAQGIWGGVQQQPQGLRPSPGGPTPANPANPAPPIPPGGAGGNMPDPATGLPPGGTLGGVMLGGPEVSTGQPPPQNFRRVGTPPPGAQVPPGTPGQPGAPGAPTTPGTVAPPIAAPAPRPGPVAPGTVSPSGTPVNPDGSFTNPDGGRDWMPGYGPSMSFGGQETRTGRAPTAPDPGDPDTVTGGQRGTPAWRQAYAAHDAWIKSQLDSGLHLADLGLSPTRGGGLSVYMRYGGYQGGQAGGGAAPTPAAPAAPTPPGPNTGGGLPGVVPGQMQYGGGGGQLDAVIRALLGMGGGQ